MLDLYEQIKHNNYHSVFLAIKSEDHPAIRLDSHACYKQYKIQNTDFCTTIQRRRAMATDR